MSRKMRSLLLAGLFGAGLMGGANTALAAPDTIIVLPSGDVTGHEDVGNIRDALGNVALGGTVELTSGDYYFSSMMVVPNFAGTLKGAGTDQTVIRAGRSSRADGDGFKRSDGTTGQAAVMQFPSPAGSLTFEDFTIQVVGPNPCDPYANGYLAGQETTAINAGLAIMFNVAPVQISGASVRGGRGDAFGKNLVHGLLRLWGEGDMDITDSAFTEVGLTALEFWHMNASTLHVADTRFDDNCEAIAIGANAEETYSIVEISDCLFEENLWDVFTIGCSRNELGDCEDPHDVVITDSNVDGDKTMWEWRPFTLKSVCINPNL